VLQGKPETTVDLYDLYDSVEEVLQTLLSTANCGLISRCFTRQLPGDNGVSSPTLYRAYELPTAAHPRGRGRAG
jgi:hypothetical protein